MLNIVNASGVEPMFALIRFVFVFYLGWMSAVWIYDVQLPVESLQDSISNKVAQIKKSKFLGVNLFETPRSNEDISLPNELNP